MYELKRKAILLCLVAPAAGGKTTIARMLIERHKAGLTRSISVTSRPPRPGETPGESYIFVSREEFEERIRAKELFEWEEVHGNLYGQLNSTLRTAVESSRDLVLDIDIRGALTVKQRYPGNAVLVFLVPPSLDVLLDRIKARGPVSGPELERRLASADREYKTLLELGSAVDYVVVNDRLEAAFEAVNGILLAERARLSRLNQEDLARLCCIDKVRYA